MDVSTEPGSRESSAGWEKLASLLDLIADGVGGLGPVEPGVLAGPSPQAQENRAIHISYARLAAVRAQEMRQRLPELVAEARAGLEQVRLRQERLSAERTGIAGPLAAAMSGVTGGQHPDASPVSVVRAAVDGIPAVDVATISLRDKLDRVTREVASDPVGEALTERQTGLDQGPCLDVARTGEAVEVLDLAAVDVPWPAFASVAVAHGVRSVLALPLRSALPSGSLSLWSCRPHAFDATTRALGELFVRHASLAITEAERCRSLERALESRDLIGQAKGILMARRTIDADAAFQLLVDSSQDTNVKLVDVARWVTENLAEPGGE